MHFQVRLKCFFQTDMFRKAGWKLIEAPEPAPLPDGIQCVFLDLR